MTNSHTQSQVCSDETEVLDSDWFYVCNTDQVPENGGVGVLYEREQLALFHFKRRNEWYATQNQCPHRKQMVLSRGMIGTQGEEPKVACPFHKKTFSLRSGACLNDETCDSIKVFPVKVLDNKVYIDVSSLRK